MVGLDILGAQDYFKTFGKGWEMVHETIAPYLEPVKAVPIVGPMIDAGDTVYKTYRHATGDKTKRELEDEAKTKGPAETKDSGKPTPTSSQTTPQSTPQSQPTGEVTPKKSVWPAVSVFGGGAAVLLLAILSGGKR
jgi:hypothetical protein